jgi:hypothetical protein
VTALRFTIGTAFPASNPVARFVTVLAMMSNDWLRLIQDLLALESDDVESVARRIGLFRQQAALHHEAVDRLQDAPRQFNEIRQFMDSLDAAAEAEYDIIIGGTDPASPHYLGDWLEKHRHVTFHYPVLQRDKAAAGQEELHDALTRAAQHDGTIAYTDDALLSVRFRFADEVTVQWLPPEEDSALLERLSQSGMALTRYVQRAVGAYLDSLPPGTYTVERD